MSSVTVRVIGPDGKLTDPTEVPIVAFSDAEWRKRLTPDQYRIARGKNTEPAFCGGLLNNKTSGMYVCVCCNLPLFDSHAKFDSKTGWPSFFQPAAKENIREEVDKSHGMTRTEILCRRCGAHLGHVFDDGPRPTGRRYCLNSESMRFVPADQLKTIAEPTSNTSRPSNAAQKKPTRAEAVFAGGCFWCVEAVFQQLDGVLEVTSGYAGGTADTANYEAVSTGRTGHAEAVKIIYDPRKLSYDTLLKVHFATHDPTTLNRQGNDVGTQYRSGIYYEDPAHAEVANALIREISQDKLFGASITTEVQPLHNYWPAEDYHQDYYAKNPLQGYCAYVVGPKVVKFRKTFARFLKDE